LSVIKLPGVYSVIVPPPSVVVVVVVVLEVCAQANGATTASAMLSNFSFTDDLFLLWISRKGEHRETPSRSRRQVRFLIVRTTPARRSSVKRIFRFNSAL
jgi:hypothetical protein